MHSSVPINSKFRVLSATARKRNYCPRICKILRHGKKKLKQRWHPLCWLKYISSYALPSDIPCVCEDERDCKKAQVLAIRWMEKSSETKNAATQTSPPRRNRIKTEFHDVGVQTDHSMCHIQWRQPSAGARFVLRTMQGMELDQAGPYVSHDRGGSNRVNKTSRHLGDGDQRQPDDRLPGSSAHMRNGMPLNTTQKLSHGPPLVAYQEQGKEDMLEILRGSNNDNKDEFESRFRPQHPLGDTANSLQAHQKSTAMAVLGSHPTLATLSSADEMQGQRSKNGERGLDSPRNESIVEGLDCDQCEPGEDVVMGTPPSAEEIQGQRPNGERGSDSPKGESNVEGQCEPGEDVVMGTPSSADQIQGQRPKNGERGSDSPKGESNVEGLDCDRCEPGEDVVMGTPSSADQIQGQRPKNGERGSDSPKGDSNVEGLDCDQCEPGEDVVMVDDNRERQMAVNHSDGESVCNYQSPVVDMTPKRPIDEEIGVESSQRPVGAKRTRYAWAGQLAPYPFPDWDLGESSQMLRQKYEGLFHSFICKPTNDFNCQSMRLNDAVWWPEAEKVAMVESTARESSILRTTQRGPELSLVEDAQVNRPEEAQARRVREGVTSNLPRDPRTPIGSGWAWPDNAETNGKSRPSVITTAGEKPRKSTSKKAEKNTSFKTNAVKKAATGKGKGEKQKGPPKRRPKSLRPFYTENEDEKKM
ncbi:hypothetical protein B0H13DRAFT_1855295 [Mycena leptocephala]|nr:hypothetical protein B0H13DRAFT_1855295 [Mycena leptocephala]